MCFICSVLNCPLCTTSRRSPIKQGSYCILRAKVDSIEGRKLRMSATIEDAETGKLQVDSTTLFINMKLTAFQQIAWSVQKFLDL